MKNTKNSKEKRLQKVQIQKEKHLNTNLRDIIMYIIEEEKY